MIPSDAVDVGAGADGSVWIVSSEDDIYRRDWDGSWI